jgi:hypothetical protein
MNVIFHTTTAFGVSVLLTDTKAMATATNKKVIEAGVFGFLLGLLSHGTLDYIPHCYPINSKLDAIAGLTMIIALVWLTKKRYRLITGLSFVGSLFPDLVDLSPGILNKQLGLSLPIINKIFPWHWHEYSGSIYGGDCGVSTANHLFVILTVIIICWSRRSDLKQMININRG